ncbi:MAG: AI-2E family transporter [Patescibacteria group bacterium]
MNGHLEIGTSTMLRFLLLILGLWFLFVLRDLWVLLFIVLIIVTALSPTVDRWAKTITRPGAVVSVFLLLLVAFAAIFSLLIPPLVEQLQEFSQRLPFYAEKLSRSDSNGFVASIADITRANLLNLSKYLTEFGSILFEKTIGVISGVVAVITVLILVFYLLLEEEGLRKIYRVFLPNDWRETFSETTRKISAKLGAWLRGQLLLMAIVGVLTTLGLLIIGSPYAMTLGLWSAVTEAIPVVGPFIGAIPGVTVGLAESPLQGFLALLVYLVVQQLENTVLVPKIMARAVGLNPFIVILAILIGNKLYGLLGVLLAVPLAAIIGVLAEDWPTIRQSFKK